MDARENLLRVIRHDAPGWVPDGMESVIRLYSPVVERPECAGADAFGVQWAYGAMGNARWKGVRLKDVLAKAGIAKDAVVQWNGV